MRSGSPFLKPAQRDSVARELLIASPQQVDHPWRMRTLTLLLCCIVVAACGEGRGAAGECSSFQGEECEAAEGCMSLFAVPLDGEEHPDEDWEFIACETAEDCGDLVTCARDESGASWSFPNTCVPSGWHVRSCDFSADAGTN